MTNSTSTHTMTTECSNYMNTCSIPAPSTLPTVVGIPATICSVPAEVSAPSSTDFISRAEVERLLRKLELSIKSDLNSRLLDLEEQIRKTAKSGGRRPSWGFRHHTHIANQDFPPHSHQQNTLPFRIVWGTPFNTSS